MRKKFTLNGYVSEEDRNVRIEKNKYHEDLEAFESMSNYEIHNSSRVRRKIRILFKIKTNYCILYHL